MRMPEPEMLWEPDDPAVVLAERFGHADAAAAVRWLTGLLRRGWGLEVLGCHRLVMSSANALAFVDTSDGPRVVKWCVAPDRFARLAAVAGLTDRLARAGLPVSAPVPDTAGRVQVEVDGVSAGLQVEVAGDLLDVADARQVHAAGVVLARLHDALATETFDGIDGGESMPLPEQLADRLDRATSAPPEARAALRRLVAAAPDGLAPTQLVHGDVRAANLLCRGGEVVAVLDLEEVRRDHPVVELARSAVLLGTRFHDWGPVPAQVRDTFRAGYASVRPLGAAEAAWWDVLVVWTSLSMGAPDDRWVRSALDHLRSLGLEG